MDESEGDLSAMVSLPEVDGYIREGSWSIDDVQSVAMDAETDWQKWNSPQSYCDVSDASLRTCFKLHGGHVCDEVERNETPP